MKTRFIRPIAPVWGVLNEHRKRLLTVFGVAILTVLVCSPVARVPVVICSVGLTVGGIWVYRQIEGDPVLWLPYMICAASLVTAGCVVMVGDGGFRLLPWLGAWVFGCYAVKGVKEVCRAPSQRRPGLLLGIIAAGGLAPRGHLRAFPLICPLHSKAQGVRPRRPLRFLTFKMFVVSFLLSNFPRRTSPATPKGLCEVAGNRRGEQLSHK